MDISQMEHLMERQLRESIQEHFPLDWKEDLITHDWVRRFRRCFHDTKLIGMRHTLNIAWEIYKLHGRRETSYGDVGILIRYKLQTGTTVEGAGFIEAKLRGRDTTKFQQVRHEQVTRILARSPQTRLLLYDYNPVSVLDGATDADWEWDFPHPFRHRRGGHSRVTHAPTLPLQLAATVNQYDDTLYPFCHSLAHQFIFRYFYLYDLDFSDSAINAVKGFPSDLGAPNFVMVIRASVGGQELPEEFTLNDNLYRTIEE